MTQADDVMNNSEVVLTTPLADCAPQACLTSPKAWRVATPVGFDGCLHAQRSGDECKGLRPSERDWD